LTGAPTFTVTPSTDFVDEASLQAGFDALKASDQAGYLSLISTAAGGQGSD